MGSFTGNPRIFRLFKTVNYSRNLIHTSNTLVQKKVTDMPSIHSGNIEEVHQIPMSVIIRPLVPTLDENKVKSLMETLKDPEKAHKVPPIDVLWVKGREGGNYYYSFGGCHRYEAFKRLNRQSIPCKLVKSTEYDIGLYLGSSKPELK